MSSSIFSYLDHLGETKIDFEFGRSEKINALFYKKLPIIIVCGTNGKGSTCMFLENILLQAGYKVGTYISPHVEKVNERIRINGESISDEMLEKYGQITKQKIESANIQPTYFEFLTFLAVHIFENESVDVGIFEVGLGGRLDSVNALPRIGAILTSVSMDHMNYLGNTLTKIAGEKIAVLENSPFSVVAEQQEEVEDLIQNQLKNPYEIERKDFVHSGSANMFVFEKQTMTLGPIQLGINGDHQSSNAAIATAMALYLRSHGHFQIGMNEIAEGLSSAHNTARLELWKNPAGHEIWLDVAHNPDAIDKLVQHFYVRKKREFHIIFGCSSDKPYQQMIESLLPIKKTIHFVTTPTRRSWNPNGIKLRDAVSTFEEQIRQQNFPILCTGSFYHVGEVRKHLPTLGFLKQ